MNFQPLRSLLRRAPELGPAEPDFICAGMEKAATLWLYDQLEAHPDFWMPPVKELRYLHAPNPAIDDVMRLLERQKQRGRKLTDRAGQAFLEEAATLAGQPRDIEKYAQLFRFKGRGLCGDLSPGYWRLKEPEIAALAARFPRLRVVLMVRDPVERVWSHICMEHRLGRFDAALLDGAARFARWFARCVPRRASFATLVPPRWAQAAPAIPFRYFFFDDVEANPTATRAEIIRFLGGDPQKKSGKHAPGYNRKAGMAKLPLTEEIKAVLVESLAGEVRDSARLFGGPAKQWPARYGL
jgi:hypothetical protein